MSAKVSELRVLALLRYRENFLKYGPLLRADFFSIAETKDVFRAIGSYHSKYSSDEADKVPLSFLRIKAEEVEDASRRQVMEGIIDDLQIKNRKDEFVEDLVRKFGQRALLKQAVIDTFDMIQGKEDTLDLDTIKAKIQEACEITTPSISRVSFFDDAADQLAQADSEPRVPTGIQEIDEHTRGGLPYGRLGLVVAPPKRGKTAYLVNIGAGAVRAGKKVIHLSLEINKRETSIRYASCFSDKPFLYLRENRDDLTTALTRIKRRKGELYIEEIIGHSPTVEELEAIIRGYGVPFDLAIVDYPDLCSTKSRHREERADSKEVYTALRRMGVKLNMAVWGASQSNRGSFGKTVVSMEDIAEDVRKIAICDIGVFVCQTPEEKEDELARLFIGATRFSSRNPIFKVGCNFENMRIWSLQRRDKHE